MISAGKNGIEMCVSRSELSCQLRLNGTEVIPPVIPPANTGLVCHQNSPNPQRITTRNCTGCPFNHAQVFDPVKVMRIGNDYAISIEK